MTPHRVVLAYHGVGECPNGAAPHDCLCVDPDVFGRQMAFLARRRQVVPLVDLLASRVRTTGVPQVAVTFDDGYRNVLENAVPELRRHGFPATVFVPTRWVGADNAWEAGRPCHPLALMDEDELREVERLGVAVESHGHAHIDLAAAGDDAATADLATSRRRLAEIMGRSPRYLAYPYGRQSPAVHAAAAAAGFTDAFGFNEPGWVPFGRERVSIDGREGLARLALKTAGGYLARRHSRLGTAGAALVRRVVPRPPDPSCISTSAEGSISQEGRQAQVRERA